MNRKFAEGTIERFSKSTDEEKEMTLARQVFEELFMAHRGRYPVEGEELTLYGVTIKAA